MADTSSQYDQIIRLCADVFSKKTADYGTAWRVLRTPSLTDQIYIKARRIRSIEEKGEARIAEGVIAEFIGIVNYSVMAVIQLHSGAAAGAEEADMPAEQAIELYHRHLQAAKDLMTDKNHDYDEAWRRMRISSLTDIIMMKILRLKSIEDHGGNTLVSEGLEANYNDIANYAVFALIRLVLEKEKPIANL